MPVSYIQAYSYGQSIIRRLRALQRGEVADWLCPGDRGITDPWLVFLQHQWTPHIIIRVSHQWHFSTAEVLHANRLIFNPPVSLVWAVAPPFLLTLLRYILPCVLPSRSGGIFGGLPAALLCRRVQMWRVHVGADSKVCVFAAFFFSHTCEFNRWLKAGITEKCAFVYIWTNAWMDSWVHCF